MTRVDNTSTPRLEEVNQLALELMERGVKPTIAQAKAHIFETRPALAKAVQDEIDRGFAAENARKSAAAGRSTLQKATGARLEVEKAAQALVSAGTLPNLTQARSYVYVTQPKLAERVRAEQQR